MKSDPVLKFIVLVLVLAGFFILASASIGLTTRKDLPPYYYLLRQVVTGGVFGFLALALTVRINYRVWKRWALPIFVLSLILAGLVFVPGLGLKYGGAWRWLAVGPVSFQPSEFLKFGLLLYLSALLSSRRGEVASFGTGFMPFITVTALAGLILIIQPDVGTLGVMVFSVLLLFLVAGGHWKHFLIVVLLGLILLGGLVYFEPYRLERVRVFFNPTYDPQGAGYQIRQAVIAIGSGGVFGRGLGMSRQKFQYLPEPIGDSIFAVAAEEFGFVGSTALLFLFLAFAWRGFKISAAAPDSFGRLLGAGIVILITVQSLVNITALTGLVPLTGIPLTFISQGGSALAVTLAQVGILLNISRYRNL